VEAPVFVDGTLVGTAPNSFTVPLCSKKLVAVISETDKYEADLDLKENETTEIRAVLKGDLESLAAEGHAKAAAFADKKPPEKKHPYFRQGASVLGVGILLAATGTGLAVGAVYKFEEYEDLTDPARVAQEMVKPGFSANAYQRKVDKVYKQAEDLDTSGIAMFAVGGAAIATGIVLMCLTEDVPVQAMVSPNGVYLGFSGRF